MRNPISEIAVRIVLRIFYPERIYLLKQMLIVDKCHSLCANFYLYSDVISTVYEEIEICICKVIHFVKRI